jgi:hypothetical protein
MDSVRVDITETRVQVDLSPVVVQFTEAGMRGMPGPAGVGGTGAIPPIAFSYGDAARAVFTPDVPSILVSARVRITVPFDGAGPEIRLGTAADDDAFMSAADSDPTMAAEFETTPDVPLADGASVRLTITPGAGATQGAGVLLLNVLPAS